MEARFHTFHIVRAAYKYDRSWNFGVFGFENRFHYECRIKVKRSRHARLHAWLIKLTQKQRQLSNVILRIKPEQLNSNKIRLLHINLFIAV